MYFFSYCLKWQNNDKPYTILIGSFIIYLKNKLESVCRFCDLSSFYAKIPECELEGPTLFYSLTLVFRPANV